MELAYKAIGSCVGLLGLLMLLAALTGCSAWRSGEAGPLLARVDWSEVRTDLGDFDHFLADAEGEAKREREADALARIGKLRGYTRRAIAGVDVVIARGPEGEGAVALGLLFHEADAAIDTVDGFERRTALRGALFILRKRLAEKGVAVSRTGEGYEVRLVAAPGPADPGR